MNLTNAKIEKKAANYAHTLLKRAHEHEPNITVDLQKIASEVAAELVGLEHKFKTEESLTRKLVYRAVRIFEYKLKQGFSEEIAIQAAFSELIERQNDVLRYTFVLPFEKYVFGFRHSLEKLKLQGYEILKDKIWNAWKNVGTGFDKGYRGINITVFSSQEQKFELQFHTEASFRLKIKTHKLYKEAKMLKTSRHRKIEIAKMMIELAKETVAPQGVKKL